MATASTTPTNSIHTEDDYSFISRAQGPSLQPPFLFDQSKGQFSGADDLPSSPLSNGSGSSIGEHEHLITSYHALQTAYDHMKRKFSETVEIKNSLQRRLRNISAGNSMDRSSSVQQMAANHENEVAKAWEAYSDKCKECEKLRDDLRAAEQRALKNQMDARDMSMREDMLRAKSQHEEHKEQLQQAQQEIRDHKDKLEMAREELQKEKEYLTMLQEKTVERHNEMELTIESLRQELLTEKRKNQEFIKDFEKQRYNVQEAMNKRESQHKDEIRKIEERLYQEQDQRSHVEHELVELNTWKQNMDRVLESSGIPISLPVIQQKRMEFENDDSDSACSDVDATELMSELRSITQEIADLKKRTSYQSSLINEMYDTQSLQSMCNGFDSSESFNIVHPPPQFSQMARSSDSSSQPSMDQRQIIPTLGSFEQTVKAPIENGTELGIPATLAVSRQIHTVEVSSVDTNGQTSDRNSPKRIDILPMSSNLSDAFTNICLHKASGDLLHPVLRDDVADTHTSFYSALTETTGPLGDGSHMTKTIHASESSDSTTDTLVEGSMNSIEKKEEPRFVPPPVSVDRLPQRFGVPMSYGNQPVIGHKMQTIWPSAGTSVGGSSMTPLWPPNSSNQSSFDILSNPSDSSLESTGINLPLGRSKGVQDYAEFLQKTGAREFKVQPVNRPRDASYPPTSSSHHLKHPATILPNRARSADYNSQNADDTPRPAPRFPPASRQAPQRTHADRRSSAVEQEEDDKAFMAAPDKRDCPVCGHLFSAIDSESIMSLHINSHFSDDEMVDITSPMS